MFHAISLERGKQTLRSYHEETHRTLVNHFHLESTGFSLDLGNPGGKTLGSSVLAPDNIFAKLNLHSSYQLRSWMWTGMIINALLVFFQAHVIEDIGQYVQ